ncbi:head completion/stabilization protein [Providencia alcalifaciens]|uniref:head completion/stabilization protein n=1 Tax=Providencia alcalifaciens TaxID=126385 RepID=UPI0018C55F22|nr:head completion/stabilization protein [Providencia alcalifaciens]
MDFTSSQSQNITDEIFHSGDFFPDIHALDYQKSMLTDGKLTPERLKHAITTAIIEINRELSAWRQSQIEKGYASMDKIPAEFVNTESELVLLYRRAVYSQTKANLTERYRDVDTTNSGEKKAEGLGTTIDELWRDVQWAIQRIKGESHNIVELI